MRRATERCLEADQNNLARANGGVGGHIATVKVLLASGGSDPVITKEPDGAWTKVVTDKAGLTAP